MVFIVAALTIGLVAADLLDFTGRRAAGKG
jgi:hypothetical protein